MIVRFGLRIQPVDALKTRAPFWKKEEAPDGERWINARGSNDATVLRWTDS